MDYSRSPLILPGDLEYTLTLNGALPPVQGGVQPLYIQRPGSPLVELATPEQMREYLFSGEYDERLNEMDQDVENDEWIEDSQILALPLNGI